MAQSALGSLAEGFLQGHAIKEQQKQDKIARERQKGIDAANASHQQWQQGLEERRLKSDQDAAKERQVQFDQTNLVRMLDEARKAKADENRDKLGQGRLDMSQARIFAGMDKAKQTFVEGQMREGVPFEVAIERAAALQGSSAAGAPQSAPVLPNAAGSGATGLPAALLQGLPLGGQGSPAPPGAPDAGTAGVSPLAQSKMAKNDAAIAHMTRQDAQAQFHSEWLKQRTATEIENGKLVKAKTGLTHAQQVKTETMIQIDGDMKKAETILVEARVGEALARTELVREQKQHIGAMDALKKDSSDLNTEVKKANFRKSAISQEAKIASDRRKAEDAMGKLEGVLEAEKIVAGMDKTKIKPSETALLAQVKMAEAQLPYLNQRVAEMKDRIDAFKKDEAEAHEYAASVTNYLNKDGSANKPATARERTAARKAAANPPKLPPQEIKLAPVAGPGKKPVSFAEGKLRTISDKELAELKKQLEKQRKMK